VAGDANATKNEYMKDALRACYAIHPSAWKNLYENVKPQSEFRRWFRHAASPTQH
jgi:hypothetical protein